MAQPTLVREFGKQVLQNVILGVFLWGFPMGVISLVYSWPKSSEGVLHQLSYVLLFSGALVIASVINTSLPSFYWRISELERWVKRLAHSQSNSPPELVSLANEVLSEYRRCRKDMLWGLLLLGGDDFRQSTIMPIWTPFSCALRSWEEGNYNSAILWLEEARGKIPPTRV